MKNRIFITSSFQKREARSYYPKQLIPIFSFFFFFFFCRYLSLGLNFFVIEMSPQEMYPKVLILCQHAMVWTMRPKARGWAKHCGPPGSLKESDPAFVILHVMDRWLSQELPSCKLLEIAAAVIKQMHVHYLPSRATSRKESMTMVL